MVMTNGYEDITNDYEVITNDYNWWLWGYN